MVEWEEQLTVSNCPLGREGTRNCMPACHLECVAAVDTLYHFTIVFRQHISSGVVERCYIAGELHVTLEK